MALRRQLQRQPDLTLAELRDATGFPCTLPALHYMLAQMGLTYKKRRSEPMSKTAQTSAKPGANGGAGRPPSSPGVSSF